MVPRAFHDQQAPQLRAGSVAAGHLVLPHQARDQSASRMRTKEIALSRPRFGYERITIMLRREGGEGGTSSRSHPVRRAATANEEPKAQTHELASRSSLGASL